MLKDKFRDREGSYDRKWLNLPNIFLFFMIVVDVVVDIVGKERVCIYWGKPVPLTPNLNVLNTFQTACACMCVCVGVMERHEVRQLIQGIPVATTVLTKSPLIWSNDNSIALVTQHGTYILVGNCFICGLLLYNYGRNNFFFFSFLLPP